MESICRTRREVFEKFKDILDGHEVEYTGNIWISNVSLRILDNSKASLTELTLIWSDEHHRANLRVNVIFRICLPVACMITDIINENILQASMISLAITRVGRNCLGKRRDF